MICRHCRPRDDREQGDSYTPWNAQAIAQTNQLITPAFIHRLEVADGQRRKVIAATGKKITVAA